MRQLKLTDKKYPEKTKSSCEKLAFDLLNSVTVIHIAHLAVSGPGSYATHMALNSYYEDVVPLIDDVVEQYQGVTGELMVFPEQAFIPRLKTSADCCMYLKQLRTSIDNEQSTLGYSEIVNVLDEIKSLIDSVCYKLTFLK